MCVSILKPATYINRFYVFYKEISIYVLKVVR